MTIFLFGTVFALCGTSSYLGLICWMDCVPCRPERNAVESKDLRIIVTFQQYFCAKVLRLALLAQDDSL